MTTAAPINRYTRTAMAFHWAIALLIVVNVGLAWTWPQVAKESVGTLVGNHKSIGLLILGLAAMRLLWRWTHRPPPFPTHYAGWEKLSANTVHYGLYLVMFAMPLSGLIMGAARDGAAENPLIWFGIWEMPHLGFILALDPATREMVREGANNAHGLLAWLLYGLITLHIGGALKHQIIDRDPELQRMLP